MKKITSNIVVLMLFTILSSSAARAKDDSTCNVLYVLNTNGSINSDMTTELREKGYRVTEISEKQFLESKLSSGQLVARFDGKGAVFQDNRFRPTYTCEISVEVVKMLEPNENPFYAKVDTWYSEFSVSSFDGGWHCVRKYQSAIDAIPSCSKR